MPSVAGSGTSIKPFDEPIKGNNVHRMQHAVLTAGFLTSHKAHLVLRLNNESINSSCLKVFKEPEESSESVNIRRNSLCLRPMFLTVLTCFSHHFHGGEDVTEVVATLQILGDVSKSAEVVRVLGGAGDVPDLVLRDDGLMERRKRKWRGVTGNQLLMEAEHRDTHTHTHTVPLPSWLHRWTWPLGRWWTGWQLDPF